MTNDVTGGTPLKRWAPTWKNNAGIAVLGMESDNDGNYVLVADHDRIVKKRDERIAELEEAAEQFDSDYEDTTEIWESQNRELKRGNDELRAELETERIRLAGCGVAALMNTEELKANRVSRDNPYWSASYQDVCNMVDREIELREELATARKVIEKLREQRNAWRMFISGYKDEMGIEEMDEEIDAISGNK